MKDLQGKLDPGRVAGPGAAKGDALMFDGLRWVPLEVVTVGTTEPADPYVGQLFYDTDA